ncbi:MAG: helix-turn-helix transcriptional regulator [Bryobacteraceae bacterium]|jgi:antitoxin component HigA of HigAB toxin-antitoxin module
MAHLKDQFQEFISDSERRRLYEREALALDASELISRLMQERKVNKTDLADLAGTSKSHITSLLSGSRNMTLHTLADLAFVLGHKLEIRAAPLAEETSWPDMDSPGTQTRIGRRQAEDAR